MFHSLQSLFRHTTFAWEETDIRHYIQEYLQRRLKIDSLYCEKARDGVIVVRVGTPTARQEVSLLEFDLARDLKKDTAYILRQLVVYTSF